VPRKKKVADFPEISMRTGEVARILGMSHRNLMRKLSDGSFPEPSRSSPGGWRQWTEKDIQAIRILLEANQ